MNYPNKRPAIIPVGPSIAYIQLTKGQYALVDSDIAQELSKFNWSAKYSPTSREFYAFRAGRSSNRHKNVFLHREVLNCDGIGDHINGRPLDNRRCNLRVVTPSQSSINRRSKKGETGIKGVMRVSKTSWIARISVNYRTVYLGRFPSPESAEAAYRLAAESMHGEFARC